MNNSQVAHLWANEAKPHGRGSNFYFDGPALYSYGSHFCVGRIVRNKQGKRAYLLNSDSYSSSTSKHQHLAGRAIAHGETVFHVPQASSCHIQNRERFKAQIASALASIPTRRTARMLDVDISCAQRAAQRYNAYSAFFSLRGRLKVPSLSAADHERRARYKRNASERTARATEEWEAGAPERARVLAEREAAATLRDAERRQDFRNGAPRQWWLGSPCMLRLNGDTFETSQGADVPRADGVAMLQYIARTLRDPHVTLPCNYGDRGLLAGGFALREIAAEHATIGCHTIPMSECAAMAALVGVEWPS